MRQASARLQPVDHSSPNNRPARHKDSTHPTRHTPPSCGHRSRFAVEWNLPSMANKRIGILTGGGDVPGLNAVIKTVTYRSAEIGYDVIGIRRGWEGLTHLNLDDPSSAARYVLPLNRENTRAIDRTGGTMLHSSRTNPLKMKKLPDFLKDATFPIQEHGEGRRRVDGLRHELPGSQEHREARPGVPGRDRRRRYV